MGGEIVVRIQTITTYADFLAIMEEYIPLLADYLEWNFTGRYQHYPKMFVTNEGIIPPLDDVLAEPKRMRQEHQLSKEWDQKLRRDFTQGLWFFLAFVDGKLTGMMRLLRRNDREAELHSVYVDPSYRGLKIGTKLLESVIKTAREVQMEVIYLDTLPFMEHAIKLYQNMGFEYVDYIDFPKYTRSSAKEFETVFMERDL